MKTFMPALMTLVEKLNGRVTVLIEEHITCVNPFILSWWEEKPSNATCNIFPSGIERN